MSPLPSEMSSTVTHKTESMFGAFGLSLNSFECKTYMKKVLVHQRKNLIRAMQPLKNYVIPIRGDEDMGNSNQGPIDSVL